MNIFLFSTQEIHETIRFFNLVDLTITHIVYYDVINIYVSCQNNGGDFMDSDPSRQLLFYVRNNSDCIRPDLPLSLVSL